MSYTRLTDGRWGIRTHDPLIKSQRSENDNTRNNKDLDKPQLSTVASAYKHPLTEENSSTPLPSELIEIVNKWDSLPDHIKQTIKTLVGSVTVTNEEISP